MTRYRAVLEYDGTAYHGFQRQANSLPTIQQLVEEAIVALTNHPSLVHGAGRTDTGVHAKGQVIAFDVDWQHDEEALARAINRYLPDDIAIQSVVQQPQFHPRFDATSRLYEYQILVAKHRQPLWNKRAWHLYTMPNFEGMQETATMLIGRHDFATFGKPPNRMNTNTYRDVFQSCWEQRDILNGTLYTYQIEATAFLKHMVRRTVGLLAKVGQGKVSVEEFADIFHSKEIARAKSLAPPQGLTLVRVNYPE